MDRERESFFFHLLVLKIGFKGQVFKQRYCYRQVKSSHLYLYSAFNNTNCVKVTAQYQNKENSVSLMKNDKIKRPTFIVSELTKLIW